MRSTHLQRQIDDLVAQGWRIEDEDTDRVVMVNREFGSLGSHLVVAVLTIWWTMGLGNLAWGAYKYTTESDRRVLWEDGAGGTVAAGCPNCGADVAPDDSYCQSCGTDLEAVRADESAGTTTCPECEAVVTGGSRYCSACGTKLADAMATGTGT
ncbi:zinc ribbon domain-containing protein [Halomontanus rarus]|uniref:zinc ribbon domain-containing protein n=1 Tax=Halomontanus rarus TaxID=3034020 RepID=UPI0023E8BA18|nr:zinc ribbon domain-containing protein [Halovivax sp. TS33]